jgi:p24 family protein alpha
MHVGTFKAEEWNADTNVNAVNSNLGIKITVDVHPSLRVADQEIFDNDHRVISQKSGATGRFTFTTTESGEHKLCFQTSSGTGGWFSSTHVKLHLDLVVGETGEINRAQTDKTESLAARVQDLNARLQDIRREQIFQRVPIPHGQVDSRNGRRNFGIRARVRMRVW